MPKRMLLPEGQLWVRWVCECCTKTGLMTLPSKGENSGTWPFDVSLGIHRTISRRCNVKDVTLRGGADGVLEVVLQRDKSKKRA